MKRTSQKVCLLEEEGYQLDSRIVQVLRDLKINISSEQDTSKETSSQLENTWDSALLDEDEWA